MEPKASNTQNTYRILVEETNDQQIIEWFGNLTLSPQENGETFVDISFNNEPVSRGFQDKLWNCSIPGLSIECIENENLTKTNA
jgi:hypothetical protein